MGVVLGLSRGWMCSCLKCYVGTSLAVQLGLGLRAFAAEGLGSIPGRGTKIPQAMWRGQK